MATTTILGKEITALSASYASTAQTLLGSITSASNASTASVAEAVRTNNAGSGTWYPLMQAGASTGYLTPAFSTLFSFNGGTGVLNVTSSRAVSSSFAITASYATYASQSGYTIQMVLATTGSNPAASTTYILGAAVRANLSTVQGATRIYVPRPGRVRYANVLTRTNGVTASAGTSTLFLTKNTTLSETLGTSTTLGSTTTDNFTSTAVSMSVAQGDFLEIRLTTPAWATLPTAVECNAIIYIENNI